MPIVKWPIPIIGAPTKDIRLYKITKIKHNKVSYAWKQLGNHWITLINMENGHVKWFSVLGPMAVIHTDI